jgi:hypothetical protein
MLALLAIIGVLYLLGANLNHVVPQQNPTTGGNSVIQSGNPLGPG